MFVLKDCLRRGEGDGEEGREGRKKGAP